MSMVSIIVIIIKDNIVDKVFPMVAGGTSTQSSTATTSTQVEGTILLHNYIAFSNHYIVLLCCTLLKGIL